MGLGQILNPSRVMGFFVGKIYSCGHGFGTAIPSGFKPIAIPSPHRKRPAVPCAAGCVRARGHEDLPLGRARCLRWRRAQAQPPPTGRAHDKITRQDRERPAPRRHMDTLARVTRGEDSRGRGRAHTPSPPASHGGQPMNMAEQCTFTFQNGRACGSSYIQSVHTATT
jgi:hypothetical protein